jgi:Ca-activated chloride channel homolog
LLGTASLVMALSRPTSPVTVPSGKATVMLAVDVSGSMCSTDIPPNRLKAAQAALLSFIDRQDDHTQIGIVAFAGFSALVQTPTTDEDALRAAVKNLNTARRTAIGSGILESLEAISEINQPGNSEANGSELALQPTPLPGGEYAPDIIVVLSDGASNSGPQPLEAALHAAERGVRVYTIGYGTASGGVMDCGEQSGWNGFGGGGFGGGGFGGGRFRRGIDEDTLMGIAEMTGGEYYTATSASELHDVFEQLPTYLITKEENQELSVAFSALGMLLAGLAVGLSLYWHPFP